MVGDKLNTICVCIVNGLPSHRHGWLHTGADNLLEHVNVCVYVCVCVCVCVWCVCVRVCGKTDMSGKKQMCTVRQTDKRTDRQEHRLEKSYHLVWRRKPGF